MLTMDNNSEFSQAQLQQTLYDICSKDNDEEIKKQGLDFLARYFRNKKMLLALLKFISDKNEDRSVQKYASICLVRSIKVKNPLIKKMMLIFLTNMKVPEKSNSMGKAFILFIKTILDTMHETKPDYFHFIAQLMMIYLKIQNDLQLHELGAIMFHALLRNMTIQMLLHAKYVAESLQMLLKHCKSALRNGAEESYILVFHTLMSAKILAQHMSRISIVLRPFRNSLQDILNLLKYFAAYGTKNHFNAVSELLRILLQHKQLSGTKWLLILKTCESICRDEEYQDFARVRTLKIFGNVFSQRRIYFQSLKICRGILSTLIEILCQKPVCKSLKSTEQQLQQLPTPLSVAADLLQFISSKFSKEEISDSVMKILLTTLKSPALTEWQFRGIFISFARIIKSCGSYLNNKYIRELITIFRVGFIDISSNVRQAAIYAMQKFFAYFYVESSHWAKQTFPAFLKHLSFLISGLQDGQPQHPMHVERFFETMKTFCNMLDRDLIAYLPSMMTAFQEILEYIKQTRIIVLTLELLRDIVHHTGAAFAPYLNGLTMRLRPYIISWEIAEYDEMRTCIVELLTSIMLHASQDFIELNGHVITGINFNLLHIQHLRTQSNHSDLLTSLKYSPLRCSIFQFFDEISNIGFRDMPELLSPLVHSITAIQSYYRQKLEQIIISSRRDEFMDTTSLDRRGVTTCFQASDNDEIESAISSTQRERYTLYDEIFIALIALQNLVDSCPTELQSDTEVLFSKLAQMLRHPYAKLRKLILYTLSNMMDSFLEKFIFEDCTFLDNFIFDIVSLIEMEIDFTIIGECVHCFLNYVAINEKYFQLDFDTHTYFMNMMTEIFKTVVLLPQEDTAQRRKKDFLLIQVIAFMPNLIAICMPPHFNNYFYTFLYIFEAKINMPLDRTAISDRKRSETYEKLIEGFHLMEKNNTVNFTRISDLFIKGLNDPVNFARENAAAGLGMLVDHCDPQPLILYKKIIKALWKRCKREKNDAVLDCIWYGIILTVKRNIWQLPIQRLSVKLMSLLPIRHIFDYNLIMVEFFEYVCLNRPEKITTVIKDIYKYLLEVLENISDRDMDPLYKRALSLASRLHSMYFDDLQQVTIKPPTMEAIHCANKNKPCLKTILRLEG